MRAEGVIVMTYGNVYDRLKMLGYEATEDDRPAIAFAMEKVEWKIKNECSLSSIPAGLGCVVVDMACGHFLYTKKQSGRLEGFDLEAAVKAVQAGDTTVTFADGASGAQQLDSLLSYLMNSGKGELLSYRKIKW